MYMMARKTLFPFKCQFCGKNFEKQVILLAKHIRVMHDPVRKRDK